MEIQGGLRETFQRIRNRSLVGEVRDELERMILEGQLAAGERLNEVTLAMELGVSRGPVREAARSLEREGLVKAVANKGVYVRKLSLEAALELYDLRAMTAGYLCARVAETATQEIKQELRAFVTDMAAVIDDDDDDAYFALNLAFHDRIAAVSGALRASALYVSLGKEVRLMRHRVLQGRAALAVSNEEHDAIVRAIESRDIEAARSAGETHHMNGKERLLQTL